MDPGEFGLRQIEEKIDSYNFNETFQINEVKNEPCEIEMTTESRSYYCNKSSNSVVYKYMSSSSETDCVDQKRDTHNYQEQNEEKLGETNLNPNDLKNFQTFDTVGIKTEQIDIFYEDIKREAGEEIPTESVELCKLCYQSLCVETDIFKFTRFILSECACQNKNESPSQISNIVGEDMTLDVKPSFFHSITESGLQLGVQDKAISEDEVTNEHEESAKPWILSMPLMKNGNKLQRKFCSDSLKNTFGEEHQMDTGEKTICSESVGQIHDLKAHEKGHTSEKPASSSRRVHWRNHTREKQFCCRICSKPISHKGHLNAHERAHTGKKPFHCKICSKSFTRKDNLKVHERSHIGGKPFHCKICSKTFSSNGHLKFHGRLHTDEKPFHCEICSKTFTTLSDLQVHGRVHTGEKPFNCKICSKPFRHKSHLNVHKRTHTGEKPFHCKICTKSFGRNSHLKVHQRTHTKYVQGLSRLRVT